MPPKSATHHLSFYLNTIKSGIGLSRFRHGLGKKN